MQIRSRSQWTQNETTKQDAIYAAVGHAAFDLYDEIDFDAWLTNSLGHELDVKVGTH